MAIQRLSGLFLIAVSVLVCILDHNATLMCLFVPAGVWLAVTNKRIIL